MRKLTFCCEIDGSPLNLLSICLTRNLYCKWYLLLARSYRAVAVSAAARVLWAAERHDGGSESRCTSGMSCPAMVRLLNVSSRCVTTVLHRSTELSAAGSHANHTCCNGWFWTYAPSGSGPTPKIAFILQPSRRLGLIPGTTRWHFRFMFIVARQLLVGNSCKCACPAPHWPLVARHLCCIVFSTMDRAVGRVTDQGANKALCVPDGQHTVIHYHKPQTFNSLLYFPLSWNTEWAALNSGNVFSADLRRATLTYIASLTVQGEQKRVTAKRRSSQHPQL